MSLSLDHSPINSGGQTSQSLGWPRPVSIPVSILAERYPVKMPQQNGVILPTELSSPVVFTEFTTEFTDASMSRAVATFEATEATASALLPL